MRRGVRRDCREGRARCKFYLRHVFPSAPAWPSFVIFGCMQQTKRRAASRGALPKLRVERFCRSRSGRAR
eukprot:968618-Rhodomonas_salina.1